MGGVGVGLMGLVYDVEYEGVVGYCVVVGQCVYVCYCVYVVIE